MAQERLWESLAAQGEAQRLAGQRWPAIAALGEATKIKPSDELRKRAIEAITTPGARLGYSVTFGRASGAYGFGPADASGLPLLLPAHHIEVGKPDDSEKNGFTADGVSFSDDSVLMAIGGWYMLYTDDPNQSTPKKRVATQSIHSRIVVLRVADGQEVDRIETGTVQSFSRPTSGDFAFRPGSTTLAFRGGHDGRNGLRLRDAARRREVGFIPGAAMSADPPGFLFSPDGSKLVARKGDRLCVLDGESLREEQSIPAAELNAFLSADEILVTEGRRLKGWNVRTGGETLAFAIPDGKNLVGKVALGSAIILVDTTPARTTSLWNIRTGKEINRLDAIATNPPRTWLTVRGSMLAFAARAATDEIVLYDLARRMSRGRIAGVVEADRYFQDEAQMRVSARWPHAGRPCPTPSSRRHGQPKSQRVRVRSPSGTSRLGRRSQVWRTARCHTGAPTASTWSRSIPVLAPSRWSGSGRWLTRPPRTRSTGPFKQSLRPPTGVESPLMIASGISSPARDRTGCNHARSLCRLMSRPSHAQARFMPSGCGRLTWTTSSSSPPRFGNSNQSAGSWVCRHSSGRPGFRMPAMVGSHPSAPTADSFPFSGSAGQESTSTRAAHGSRSNFGNWRRQNNCVSSGENRDL